MNESELMGSSLVSLKKRGVVTISTALEAHSGWRIKARENMIGKTDTILIH